MQKSKVPWFRRLADIPGVGYSGDSTVDRASLKGANTTARVRVWDYDEEPRESLEWIDGDSGGDQWGTSMAPCSEWETKAKRGEPPARTMLRQVREALELPGIARDYHFILGNGVSQLWQFRATNPWLLTELEALCLLDIRLVEAYPDAIRNEYIAEGNEFQGSEFFAVETLGFLLRLYQREGYLQEAIALARRATAFGGSAETVIELEDRLRAQADEEAFAL